MNIPSKHPDLINHTAAALVAAAAYELFPDVLLVGGQGTAEYFYFDIVFPFAFKGEFLQLLEERVRLFLREKRKIKILEMMPANAAEMMRHHGQTIAAERLMLSDRATVQMVQVGETPLYFPFPIQKELAIPFIKLIEGAGKQGEMVRVVGITAHDKETLKSRSKEPVPSERSHLRLAKEMGLCAYLPEEEAWMWLPKGEALRQRLIEWWRALHAQQNFQIVSTPYVLMGGMRQAHAVYFRETGESRAAEIGWVETEEEGAYADGLLAPRAATCDRAHLICRDEKLLEEIISSLHFIFNIPKILGFEFEIVFTISSRTKGKQEAIFRQALEKMGLAFTIEKAYRPNVIASVEVKITDALGRRWTGPFLSLAEGSLLIRSAFGSLERMAALLLEKRGGWLPLFLAPQQVKVLAVGERDARYAQSVRDALRKEGIRAVAEGAEEKLKTRLYRAFMERVPYVVLLGEREEKAGTLTVRAYGESAEQSETLEAFCRKLKDEIGSGTSEPKN